MSFIEAFFGSIDKAEAESYAIAQFREQAHRNPEFDERKVLLAYINAGKKAPTHAVLKAMIHDLISGIPVYPPSYSYNPELDASRHTATPSSTKSSSQGNQASIQTPQSSTTSGSITPIPGIRGGVREWQIPATREGSLASRLGNTNSVFLDHAGKPNDPNIVDSTYNSAGQLVKATAWVPSEQKVTVYNK